MRLSTRAKVAVGLDVHVCLLRHHRHRRQSMRVISAEQMDLLEQWDAAGQAMGERGIGWPPA